MIRAVLNSNVFVSAILSPKGIPARILTAWQAEQFQLVLSGAVLEEVARVLRYPKIARLLLPGSSLFSEHWTMRH